MMFALAGLLPATVFAAQVATAPALLDFSTSQAIPGVWSYRSVPGASEAYFMDSSGGVRVSLRCARASRQVSISRTSSAPASSLFVWTSTAQRSLPATFEQNAMRVSAAVAANDPILDAIAFSQGRIAISIPGVPPVVIAPGPEAARVFEDCRI